MKYKFLTAVLLNIFIITLCNGQNFSNYVDTIFSLRKEYINKNVPDTFKIYYSCFNKVNHEKIIDTLTKILSNDRLSNTNKYYIAEFIPDDNQSKLYGVFWSKDIIISYKWNNVKKKLDVTLGEYIDLVKPFVKDIEEWNNNVTNRSYRWSSIAGGSYVYCSRINIKNNNLKIENAVFRRYNKNHFEYYLKEKPCDNYKYRKVPNPNY